MSPRQRASTLAAAIVALDGNHNGIEGLTWMIEQTIEGAVRDALALGAWPTPKVGSGLAIQCSHMRTAQAVVGDSPALMRIQTTCLDCGAVLP